MIHDESRAKTNSLDGAVPRRSEMLRGRLLGSTTLITNDSGEVVQRVEYLPTGETFIEQQDTCRGYVGIQGTAKELISLGKFFQEYIKAKGNSMKINFQIPNNSYYGNNEKANSNIGQ